MKLLCELTDNVRITEDIVDLGEGKKPRKDIWGNRYFTDGHRLVVWVSSEPVSFSEVVNANWETPFKMK